MILIKYWREIFIALILAAVCTFGWYLKGAIDRNREMAAQVAQQKAAIANLAQQVKQVDAQRQMDNELTRRQLEQRTQQQTTRKHDDAVFKQVVQSHPQVKAWLDKPLDAAVVARLSDGTANPDGQAGPTAGPPGR